MYFPSFVFRNYLVLVLEFVFQYFSYGTSHLLIFILLPDIQIFFNAVYLKGFQHQVYPGASENTADGKKNIKLNSAQKI